MTRTRIRSNRPPTNPERSPIGRPIASEIVVATAIIARGMRAPQMMRLSTSWPDRSTPMTKRPPGAVSGSATFVFGSNGARKGAKMAMTMIASTIPIPIHTMMPAAVPDSFRKCAKRRPAGRPTKRPKIVVRPLAVPTAMTHLVPDPRVHERVHDVDEEADDDHQDAVVHDRTLERRIIAVADRIEHKTAHAFEREDGLRQDGPAEQQREREAHRRDNRDEGVLQRVPEEYRAFRNPPRACRLHEIRAHRLDDVDARNANEESR